MTPVVQYKYKIISKVKHLLLVYSVLATLCCVLSACNEDDNTIDMPANTKDVKVQFYANNLSFLRQTSTESAITEVQALVFIDNGDGYKYGYSAAATSLIATDNQATSFDITIYTVSNPVKIYILANSNNAISSNIPLAGETEEEVKQKIIQSLSSAGINGNFPMWCEYLLPSGISSSLNNNIIQLKILRAIARVDVNTVDAESSFTMTSVQAFRANSQFQIVPNAYSDPLFVTAPSVPSTSTATINTTPIAVTNNVSESQLYLPESVAPSVGDQTSSATCVVVGGRYNNSSDITYYRLDFEPDNSVYPLGQILRNHHYTFNIIKVSAPGWPTPEEAAENESTNIEVGIQDWEDEDVSIVLGGTDYFRLSTREITIAYNVGSSGYSFVATSVPDYTIQWSDAAGNPLGPPGDILNDGVLYITRSRYIIRVNAIVDNPSEDTELKYVLIVAKRAHILLKIYHEGT